VDGGWWQIVVNVVEVLGILVIDLRRSNFTYFLHWHFIVIVITITIVVVVVAAAVNIIRRCALACPSIRSPP
jgi:hypothetical protein